ncbi:G-protein coupled receptor family C group 5 member C [Pholidichthys leucotaenia]
MSTNGTPQGCGPNVDSLYYNLCNLSAVWGIVLEAVAAAGIVFSFVLFISLLASLPFIKDYNRRSSVGLHAGFLVCSAGLFGLTFAFIIGKDFATCASRRFLFGVLFGGCFSCLLMQCVRLNFLSRRNTSPRAWVLYLGALGLWLVEVVINTEWLIITIVSHPLAPLNGTTAKTGREMAIPCNIANEDFVMALIYVMTLILAVVVASLAVMAGKHAQWKKESTFVLFTGLLSVCIWVAWIVMFIYGNGRTGGPTWDDPTLAIALVSNAWVFIVVSTIPEICCMAANDNDGGDYEEDLYPSRGVGYETILKEQAAQNVYAENKAFSMDESSREVKPVSPYSGYSGQMRASVYQPTELALITRTAANQHPQHPPFDMIIPRASVGSGANSSSSTLKHSPEDL